MISVVFAGRNDHHGFVYDRGGPTPRATGDFATKVARVLLWNSDVVERVEAALGLPPQVEYVFVEWGTFKERPWLAPTLTARFPRLRAYVVSDEIVAAYQSPPVKFHEYVAKNFGIARCAESRLVVATNSDVMFPLASVEALVAVANAPPLDGVLYRAPRWDFQAAQGYAPDEAWPPLEGDDFFAAVEWRDKMGCPDVWGNAAGDFAAATPTGWRRLGGYVEAPNRMRHLDSELVDRAGRIGMPIVGLPPVFHRDHPDSSQYWSWLPELAGEALSDERTRYNEARGWGGRDLVERQIAERVWELCRKEN